MFFDAVFFPPLYKWQNILDQSFSSSQTPHGVRVDDIGMMRVAMGFFCGLVTERSKPTPHHVER